MTRFPAEIARFLTANLLRRIGFGRISTKIDRKSGNHGGKPALRPAAGARPFIYQSS